MAKKQAGSWSEAEGREARNGEHLAALEAPPPPAPARPAKGGGGTLIVLPKLDIKRLAFRVVGDSELICHKWSEKAKREMLEKQMGTASAGKEKKDPERDYLDTLYQYPGGGYGFPSIAFKNAAVSACTSTGKAISKVAARQCFHLMGTLVKIHGTPQMREDMVRVGMGTADIRYRAEFKEWSADLVVRYNARVLSAEQLVNLFNMAGFAVGVGEWRSERDGQSGLFHVEAGAAAAAD